VRLGREPPSSPEPKAEKREKVARAFARAEETLREMEILFQRGLYNGAIDRAYYAAFHAATAALLSLDLESARHSAVIAHFGKEFAKTGKLAPQHHQTLIEAFSLRQRADYDYTVKIERETAKRVVGGCRQLVEAVRTYLAQEGYPV